MQSETMSENAESTMSEVSDADTCRIPQKLDIFGKYKNNDYGINVKMIVLQTMLIKTKKTSLVLGIFVNGAQN